MATNNAQPTVEAPQASSIQLDHRMIAIEELKEKSVAAGETQQGLEGTIAQEAQAWYDAKQEADSLCASIVEHTVVLIARFNPAKADILRLLKDQAKSRDKHGPVTEYKFPDGQELRFVGPSRKDYAPMATKVYKLAAWDAGRFEPKRDMPENVTAFAAHGFNVGQPAETFYSAVDALRAGYGINVVDSAMTAVLRPVRKDLVNTDNMFYQAREKAKDIQVLIYDPAFAEKVGGRPTRNRKVAETPAGIAGTILGLLDAAKKNGVTFTTKQSRALLKAYDEFAAEFAPSLSDDDETDA